MTTDQYNNASAYYTIWNINEKEHDAIYQIPSIDPFHHTSIKIEQLLSDDALSSDVFQKSVSLDIRSPKIYILNSPVIEGNGDYKYQIIDINKAKSFIKNKQFTSAIGYESTAEILSTILELEIPYNRIQIKLNKGDQCLVFRIKDRVEKDRKLTKDEIKCLETELGILTKLSDEP
ncbi:MAG: DUF1874 domain-containing protein [Saprospiraceae bacterium]|nr:DUF1874 domain-containing protein [Saprospiraceae bacterium]